ncbi:serine hydrolase domain-containing protein [Pedobacter sp. MR22-3]|uniref:serine hydrolase domain-containing protein n=1 Tax=Pedobacter TaxID=84567 RepID=UPI0022461247|nr:serine hydrolase domain-containing protein [Pedobacter sp. MR22-3]MCX2584723.1 serine hydrolase [Pedobacter sp. MR22-3]
MKQQFKPILSCLKFAITLAIGISAFNTYAQKSFGVNNRIIDIDALNKKVDFLIKETGIPGVSLSIISNDKIVFSNSYGVKQLGTEGKINNETIFEACSLSKSFLAFVAYQLADKGRLDLDKPLYNYLKYQLLEHDLRYKSITARMVLSHSSGIENWKFMHNPDTLELMSNPGERFVYSGEGYQYLAQVIELILHKSYEDYISDMVIKPLGLKRTFTSYKSNPQNYAIGHNAFGKPYEKWKNMSTRPASGNHTTSADYAKLIIGIFNQKNISNHTIYEVTRPIVRLQENNPSVYYAAGFEIISSKNDTIISHGGTNDGFRGLMFYSPKNKTGFVLLANSDRGKSIAMSINDATVQLDVAAKFLGNFSEQYPSNAISLLKFYNESGLNVMLARLNELEHEGKLNENTLNDLGEEFMKVSDSVATDLLTKNIRLFPKSSTSHYLLGIIDMKNKRYSSAYAHFQKAKELNFQYGDIDFDINEARKKSQIPAGK